MRVAKPNPLSLAEREHRVLHDFSRVRILDERSLVQFYPHGSKSRRREGRSTREGKRVDTCAVLLPRGGTETVKRPRLGLVARTGTGRPQSDGCVVTEMHPASQGFAVATGRVGSC